MVINWNTRKTVEQAFYNYKTNRDKKLDAAYEFAVSNGAVDYDKIAIMASPKPDYYLENQLDKQINTIKWVGVVDKTVEYFKNTGKDTLIKMRYFDHKGMLDLLDTLHLEDKSTVHAWINDVLIYASMVAIQERLITI